MFPAFSNVTLNVFEVPGGRFPFGSNQPELTYCSLPLMVTFAFGADRLYITSGID